MPCFVVEYRKKAFWSFKVAENNKKEIKEKAQTPKKAPLTQKQRIIITVAAAVAGLLLCAGIICAVVLSGGESYTLDGTYVLQVEGGDLYTSTYIFDGDKVTNEYYDGDTKVIEYTYTIKKTDGTRLIILKNIKTGEEQTLTFAEKTENGKKSIMINNVWYDKQ